VAGNRAAQRIVHTNMSLDLEYIEGWSLWLDLRILPRTGRGRLPRDRLVSPVSSSDIALPSFDFERPFDRAKPPLIRVLLASSAGIAWGRPSRRISGHLNSLPFQTTGP